MGLLDAVRRHTPNKLQEVIADYTSWLHTRWPAGKPEKLPEVNPDFTTNVPGLYVVGDLTGIPLLKLSADSGVKAVRHLCDDRSFINRDKESQKDGQQVLDLIIIGGGVSGYAAALEAKERDLNYQLLEASESFSTIINFPKGKPIYTYPSDMTPEGKLQFTAKVKEPLVEEIRAQTADIEPRIARAEQVVRKGSYLRVDLAGGEEVWAHKVIVAIGRSGNFRKLGVPGEERDKVYNRLHDPKDFGGKDVLVVGGGDSALETAIAIAEAGGRVTLSYRRDEFSRPKPDNVERLHALSVDASGGKLSDGKISLEMASEVKAIEDDKVSLETKAGTRDLSNDVVFAMLGREAPLDFFRRSGVSVMGESTFNGKVALVVFALFIFLLYDWKNKAFLNFIWGLTAFPDSMPTVLAGVSEWWSAQVADRSTVIGTLAVSMKSRSFYYTFLYTAAIGFFGIKRILHRRTPYVTLQTLSLFFVQAIPLFLIPEFVLPFMDYNGYFDSGFLHTVVDNLFPLYISAADMAAGNFPEWGHPRAYWHAYGFIFAWPLGVYNVTTDVPNFWWLAISFVQTFVIIPLIVYRWGKGAFCGWICSCGGLAETMGDRQRHKMPHGPIWNRLNMIGQVFLLWASLILIFRILTWMVDVPFLDASFRILMFGKSENGVFVNPLSYGYFVDVLFAGFLGVAFYFKYSGRVWCRFACPLAALMHIYARFSQFRIFSEKKKCISCNVCTSVCHQGIDVMNFANKGLPMEDPECVRCSACVQSCPTGVLRFGRIDKKTNEPLDFDKLAASPVLMKEGPGSFEV